MQLKKSGSNPVSRTHKVGLRFAANNREIKLRKSAGLLIAVSIILSSLLFGQVLSLLVSQVRIPNSGIISSTMTLNVEGRWIKDSVGNTVILSGVNCGAFTDAPGGIWSDRVLRTYADWQNNQNFVESDLDAIKSWGCNCIRVMYAAEYWIYNIQNHRQIIKDLAVLCAERGLYMIYEGWCIRGYGNGAAQDSLPYPPYQSSTNAAEVIPTKQAYVDMMVSQATELKGYSNVLLGAWNEAGGDGYGSNSVALVEWLNVCQQVITNVRGNGSDNIILVQWDCALWCNMQFPPNPAPLHTPLNVACTLQWIYEYPLNGKNVVYQTHLYDGFGRNATREQLSLGFNYCWLPYVTNNMSKPVLIGEIGANNAYSGQDYIDELRTMNFTLNILNEWEIGYIGWTFRANVMYGLISSYGPSYNPTDAGVLLKNNIAAR